MNERERAHLENLLSSLTKTGIAVALLGWIGNLSSLISAGIGLAAGSWGANELTRNRKPA